MTADIEVRNGKVSMMYVGDTPWHNSGQPVRAPTTKEGIIAAGMNWQVEKKPLYLRNEDVFEQIGSAFVTARKEEDGSYTELGVVGKNYNILQNEDAFSFFDPYLESGVATLETAGVLSGGKRIWILAKLKGNDIPIVAKSDDVVQKYVLLSNSHDGTTQVRLGFTPIRVVCSNTLAAAHADKLSKLLRIKHTGNMVDNLSIIQNAFDAVNKKFETTVEGYRMLAKKAINKKDLEAYVTRIFKKEDEEAPINKKRVERVTELFETGKGNDLLGVEGTWWAAYNGVTQWASWENDRTEDSRLNSLWFGEANGINSQALNYALEMAA
jgi:phage/plasmid-like protein (TIGR03299 family)